MAKKEIVKKPQLLTEFKHGKPAAVIKLERQQTLVFVLLLLVSLVTLSALVYILMGLTGFIKIDWLWKLLR